MSRIITTAGRADTVPTSGPNPRRQTISAIRAVLRKTESTDDEVDDALEALAELARSDD